MHFLLINNRIINQVFNSEYPVTSITVERMRHDGHVMCPQLPLFVDVGKPQPVKDSMPWATELHVNTAVDLIYLHECVYCSHNY
jgi:hypothetical protein